MYEFRELIFPADYFWLLGSKGFSVLKYSLKDLVSKCAVQVIIHTPRYSSRCSVRS